MGYRCHMLLVAFVCVGVLALVNFGCSSPTRAAQIHRNGGEEMAKAKERKLVLQLVTNESGLQATATAAFIYDLKTEKVSVEDVLSGRLFFNSLDRLLLYAEQEGWGDQLEWNAVEFLSNGPGCFMDFAKDKRHAQSKPYRIGPDVRYYTAYSVSFVAKMKYGNGAFIFQSPSGVAPSEQWVLGMGFYVVDYAAFMKGYGEGHKENPALYRFDGKSLQ